MDGICTLGNDVVYDQLVALINSIEAFAPDLPVCIYPYDHRTDNIAAFAATRPQVQLYADQPSIQRWDEFVETLWAFHPTARDRWAAVGSTGIHRMGTHRRYCAFDGPFDRFLYMDADTLLLSDPAPLFAALDRYDWVTYDFQYKDLSHVYDLDAPQFGTLFSAEQMARQSFCSGFYASRRGLFDPADSADILAALATDAAILYPMAPDQTLLNYLVMRRQVASCNLARTLPAEQRTGNSVTSSHFQERDHRVYDGDVPLTYLHYIGISARQFAALCGGENIALPYRDTFLHYRYRHDPTQQPTLRGAPRSAEKSRPPRLKRLLKALTSGWDR